MTAADETPAQPICGAHPPYSDGHRWTCAKPPHRDDHEGDGMTWAQTRHEDEIRRRDLANAHRGEVVEGSGVAIEPRDFRAQPDVAPRTWLDDPGPVRGTARPVGGRTTRATPAQPDVAPAPDGNAGGAGDEAYLAAARRYWQGNPNAERYADSAWRAAIGVGRAPLLAEVAAYELNIEELNAKVVRECKRIAAERDEAIRERDEARAKTEELLDLLRDVWAYGAVPDAVSDQIAKWLGPVTDDGGAG